jgi:hypothetical protein
MLMLPDGVMYEKASIDILDVEGSLIGLRPVKIEVRKKTSFSIAVRIAEGTSGRLVFRSFLNNADAYCEATSAMTVRVHCQSLPHATFIHFTDT